MPHSNEPPTQAEELEQERLAQEESLLEESTLPPYIKHDHLHPCWDLQGRILETIHQIWNSSAECTLWDVYDLFKEDSFIYRHPLPTVEAFTCACHCLLTDETPPLNFLGKNKHYMDQKVQLTLWGRELVLGQP